MSKTRAFDTVQHDKLITISKSVDIDEKEIERIKNLYWHQTVKVKVDNTVIEQINNIPRIQRRTRSFHLHCSTYTPSVYS